MAKHADIRPAGWRRVAPALTGAVVVLGFITAAAFQAKAGTASVDGNVYPSQLTKSPATPAASAAQTAQSVQSAPAADGTSQAAQLSASSAEVAALTVLASGRSADAISVAALNLSTGASYHWGATGGMDTGSIVKLYILETLLLQTQDSGGLSDDEQQNATTMIENSDNDAAEALFDDIGGRDGLIAANATLGLTNTTPGPSDYWGLTQTTATDYITLLQNLVTPTGGPLAATSQAYVLALMRDVESDQRWGVGVTADAGTDFANKNGWLSVDDDNGLWLVNSTGIVTIKGQQVLMVVLTQHDSDFDSGINLVESLATALAPLVAS